MKIVLINYRFYISGGPEKYMFKFIELATEMGNTVIPFSVENKRNFPTPYYKYFVSSTEGFESTGFSNMEKTPKTFFKVFWRSFWNFEAKRKLTRLVRDEKPDLFLILIPGYLSSSIYSVAKKFHIKTITRISDFRYMCSKYVLLRQGKICEKCIYGNNFHAIKHRCVKGSLLASTLRASSLNYFRIFQSKKVDAIMAPSSFTKEIYRKSNIFKNKPFFVNPTFINCSSISPSFEHKGYVLCSGRFSEEKGFLHVVQSLKLLADVPIKVIITGVKEQCSEDLNQFIESNNLQSKVEFSGFLNENGIEKLYRDAMCVAVPSLWYENMPNVILEAFSYGKPVIGSNLGSIREMIEHRVTGLLFEAGNNEEIASCIRSLYLDPSLVESIGKNARKKCEDLYSPEGHWTKFLEIYHSLKDNKE